MPWTSMTSSPSAPRPALEKKRTKDLVLAPPSDITTPCFDYERQADNLVEVRNSHHRATGIDGNSPKIGVGSGVRW